MVQFMLLFATGCNGRQEPDALTPLDPYLPTGKTPVGFARYEDLHQDDWSEPEVSPRYKQGLKGFFRQALPIGQMEFQATRASEEDPWVYENLVRIGICPEESFGEVELMARARWDSRTFDDFPETSVIVDRDGNAWDFCRATSVSVFRPGVRPGLATVYVITGMDETHCIAAIGRIKAQDLGLAAVIDSAPECEEYWDQVD